MRVRAISVLCLAILGVSNAAENALRPVITVDATKPLRPVSPEMYGIFFEEINHAGEGGLYAELVRNRDMEASTVPEGWRVEGDQVVTTGEVVVKLVNPTPAEVVGMICLKGLSKLGARAKVITLGHADANAENTLENPDVLVPAESQMAVPGAEFAASFPANSLTVLRLAAVKQWRTE